MVKTGPAYGRRALLGLTAQMPVQSARRASRQRPSTFGASGGAREACAGVAEKPVHIGGDVDFDQVVSGDSPIVGHGAPSAIRAWP